MENLHKFKFRHRYHGYGFGYTVCKPEVQTTARAEVINSKIARLIFFFQN